MIREKTAVSQPGEDPLEAIEALHRRDVTAAKAGDFETLKSLLDDDCVLIPPGGGVIRGREAIDALYEEWREAYNEVEVLTYEQNFEEVVVLGDYAFEWGSMWGTERGSDGKQVGETFHLMRILKRQPEGEWKIHRTIWNTAEAGSLSRKSEAEGQS
jgi:uncharacterized protein (TIGR02246 family)